MMNRSIFWPYMLVLTCFISAHCKSASLKSTPLHLTKNIKITEDDDCLAWKFTILTTAYSMAFQTALQKEQEKRLDEGNSTLGIDIQVEKILSWKQAKEIVDTIIKKERGVCSKELLYNTPCVMNLKGDFNHPKKPTQIKSARFVGHINIDYFSRATGMSVTKPKIIQLERFLQAHSENSLTADNKIYYAYCDGSCRNHISYVHHNAFGICILTKHASYLKENNIFDVDLKNHYKNTHNYFIDEDSLDSFIKKSKELSES